MSPQAPHTAILTCMDARLDALGFLDEWPSAAHVVRNAGGRASADALRSLAASCAMGIERVVIIHHTDCAMAKHTDAEIRELLPRGAGAEVDFLTIGDPRRALAEDVQTVMDCDLLPADTEVRAFVYDLDKRTAEEVGL